MLVGAPLTQLRCLAAAPRPSPSTFANKRSPCAHSCRTSCNKTACEGTSPSCGSCPRKPSSPLCPLSRRLASRFPSVSPPASRSSRPSWRQGRAGCFQHSWVRASLSTAGGSSVSLSSASENQVVLPAFAGAAPGGGAPMTRSWNAAHALLPLRPFLCVVPGLGISVGLRPRLRRLLRLVLLERLHRSMTADESKPDQRVSDFARLPDERQDLPFPSKHARHSKLCVVDRRGRPSRGPSQCGWVKPLNGLGTRLILSQTHLLTAVYLTSQSIA